MAISPGWNEKGPTLIQIRAPLIVPSPRQARSTSVISTTVRAKPITMAVSTSAWGRGSADSPSTFSPSGISGGWSERSRPVMNSTRFTAVDSSASPRASRARLRDSAM